MKVKLINLWKTLREWASKYWYVVVIGVVLVVAALYISYLRSTKRYSEAEIHSLELKVDLYAKQLELSRLETQRELIKLKQGYTQQEIKEIEEKIVNTEKKIAEITDNIHDMSLDEKIDEYNRLGK